MVYDSYHGITNKLLLDGRMIYYSSKIYLYDPVIGTTNIEYYPLQVHRSQNSYLSEGESHLMLIEYD